MTHKMNMQITALPTSLDHNLAAIKCKSVSQT